MYVFIESKAITFCPTVIQKCETELFSLFLKIYISNRIALSVTQVKNNKSNEKKNEIVVISKSSEGG